MDDVGGGGHVLDTSIAAAEAAPEKNAKCAGADAEAPIIPKTNWDDAFASFGDMNLREDLLQGIYSHGCVAPSVLQGLAIVPLIGVPRAWPLPGVDAQLHWSPLEHRKAQIAVVMTVLLVGERLRRRCDQTWAEVDDPHPVASAAAGLTLDCNNACNATVTATDTTDPLAGLEETLPTELWLEVLGMIQIHDLHPKPGLDINHNPITDLQPYDVVVRGEHDAGTMICYAIAALQNLDVAVRECQILVLCPTHKLALEVRHHIAVLLTGKRTAIDCKTCVCVRKYEHDVDAEQNAALGAPSASVLNEVHIVVGTPDCVLDMIQRQGADDCLTSMRQVVIDKADEIFCRGFKDEVCSIIQLLPATTQISLLSDDITPIEVGEFTERFMRDPIRIDHVKPLLTVECIKHFYINVEREEWKLETLYDLYEGLGTFSRAVVYCNTDEKVDVVIEMLRSHDVEAVALHGDTPQQEHEAIARDFRKGALRVLITTDLGARHSGIDIPPVVINYDLPARDSVNTMQHYEQYRHRVGGTWSGVGFVQRGVAISFLTVDDVRTLREIERYCNTEFEETPLNIADLI